ncbi:DUF982 domain-containing protein [Phyllobacterium zundukense]|uniref:DUF982 domain-containing protein n=2 Tax=Phyllobacterium zundukense TaxID=1867719 RepID=A0A2N9W3D4_9HYPH|nr:DUF982 domain-containing protein [Phyllobacterium zundukense]PIO46252.1 hypothetical protein B5P45_03320 [Phyllobacterium zundukense]
MTHQVGKMRDVSCVEEAAENLAMNWPLKTGPKLSAAKQACLDALEGKILCTEARDAFIEAAKEAEIYVGQQSLKH